MPRNGSGAYSLPESAFVPNTPIVSATVNSDLDDIANALTDSLSRSGDGGMQAALSLDSDGFVYTADPNTGMRRTAGDTQAIQCGGVDIITATSTAATVNGNLAVTGSLTVGGNPLLLVGEIKIWTGQTEPAGWLFCSGTSVLRAAHPALWTFAAAEIALGNLLFTNGNGTTTFTVPNLAGYVPAGNDGGFNRLTSTTMTPNGTTLGAVGGTQTQTLLTANLPPYTPSVASYSLTAPALTIPVANLTSVAGATDTNFISLRNNANATAGTFSVTGSAGAIGGTIAMNAQGGTSTPVNKIQPTIIVNYIIYAGA